ncbi:MAG: hypothetical protein DRO99_00575 [Candidatus Aenigmatarchaeota archaeon]|nr:MAG: hypothetical protein DRO99_00575 [Candidatus Aenigmarchaeota archaeon]
MDRIIKRGFAVLKGFVLCLLLALAFVPTVSAIGITPAYREIYFEPGLHRNFSFVMIGDLEKDMVVRPITTGDLQDYIILPNRTYYLPARTAIGIWATLDMPESLDPGKYTMKIGFAEKPPEGIDAIFATVGVQSVISMRVPYPSKYLELKMRCNDPPVGEDTVFDIDVFNRGSIDLVDVNGHVEVFSPMDKLLDKKGLDEGSVYLRPKETAHFSSRWDTTGQDAGFYRAVATINYDGNVTSTMCTFTVGELNIDIKRFDVNDTIQGTTARFDALLQSTWNSEIPEVYPTVYIEKPDGTLVDTAQGPTIRIGKWKEYHMKDLYWDTTGKEPGDYVARLLLEYRDTNSTATTEFKILNAFQLSMTHVVIIALIALVAYQAIHTRRKEEDDED